MQSDLELLDRRAVCSLFGGIHPATLYRHVRSGTVPRPVKVGALSRWLRSRHLGLPQDIYFSAADPFP
jgi:predicted DNA-binding transcriptional regulator AlpA